MAVSLMASRTPLIKSYPVAGDIAQDLLPFLVKYIFKVLPGKIRATIPAAQLNRLSGTNHIHLSGTTLAF